MPEMIQVGKDFTLNGRVIHIHRYKWCGQSWWHVYQLHVIESAVLHLCPDGTWTHVSGCGIVPLFWTLDQVEEAVLRGALNETW